MNSFFLMLIFNNNFTPVWNTNSTPTALGWDVW